MYFELFELNSSVHMQVCVIWSLERGKHTYVSVAYGKGSELGIHHISINESEPQSLF